jgi:ribosomal protein S17
MVLLPIFGSPRKKKKRKYKKIKKIYSEENQKIIVVRRECRRVQKMIKNWLRRFKNTKIEI